MVVDYEFGRWGLGLAFRLSGSVFPRSSVVALIAGIASAGMKTVFRLMGTDLIDTYFGDVGPMLPLWGGFTFVVGFLLVFRTQTSYARYLDGVASLYDARTVWINAFSNLLSFCSPDPALAGRVRLFQLRLASFFSLKFCATVAQVAGLENVAFETFGAQSIDSASLKFVIHSLDQPEVILQWIQRLVVSELRTGVIDIPAPILSRIFQELSNGMIGADRATRITDYPFPFPYAQMCTVMLMVLTFFTAVFSALCSEHEVGAFAICFAACLGFWSINLAAAEIEMPFGDDRNDVDLDKVMAIFNRKLRTLLLPASQTPPAHQPEEEMVPGPQMPLHGESPCSSRKVQRVHWTCVDTQAVASSLFVLKGLSDHVAGSRTPKTTGDVVRTVSMCSSEAESSETPDTEERQRSKGRGQPFASQANPARLDSAAAVASLAQSNETPENEERRRSKSRGRALASEASIVHVDSAAAMNLPRHFLDLPLRPTEANTVQVDSAAAMDLPRHFLEQPSSPTREGHAVCDTSPESQSVVSQIGTVTLM
mmetsp:Transcript_69448/g.193234  ORF Transcript_69448/g.193234 Transcript_69448/m.193234 type:complete len:539 (+) Transcript_69448:34-1650(+)